MLTQADRKAFAKYDELDRALQARMKLCDSHHIPAPKPGSSIRPKGCTCYMDSPEWIAFMNWESPVCNICGGRERCQPNCDAIDKRY